MTEVLPEAGTPFGDRVRQRLRDEQVIWLTTIGADSTPQPNPVWFLWQDPDSVLIYNRADAHRLAHVAQRPQVALHFDGNGRGGDIVVLRGTAVLTPDAGPAHENPEYLAKYASGIASMSESPAAFAAAYPVALTVHVERIRGF